MKAISYSPAPASDVGERKQITLKGHRWSLDQLGAQLIRPCDLCQKGVDARTKCLHQRPCVCMECQKRVPGQDGHCPQCLTAGESPAHLETRSAMMRSLQAHAELQCVECRWSGSLEQIEAHISQCAQRESACASLPVQQNSIQEMVDSAIQRRLQELQGLSLLAGFRLQPSSTGEPREQCKWGCQVRHTVQLIELHYEFCPSAPVNCTYCLQQFPRQDLEKHRQRCEQRPVSCPHGCRAEGLRLWEMISGKHEKLCPEVEVPCGLPGCRSVVKNKYLEHHRTTDCFVRKKRCHFCLKPGLVNAVGIPHMSCRAAFRYPESPYTTFSFGSHFVSAQDGADGAVYTEKTTGDDPVYIKLPVPRLCAEMAAGHRLGECMTPGMRFKWGDMQCNLDMKYNGPDLCFSVSVSCQQSVNSITGRTAQARLYDQNGSVIEELGDKDMALDDSSNRLTVHGTDWHPVRIRALNSIKTSQAANLVLQLGPISEAGELSP